MQLTYHCRFLSTIPKGCDQPPNFEISLAEGDTNAQKELGAQTFTSKAYRCYYLSESYAAAKKWAESIVLFDQALSYGQEVDMGQWS